MSKPVDSDYGFVKSSFSAQEGACVNLKLHEAGPILLRQDGPDDPRAILSFTKQGMKAFFDGVKAGEFDYMVEDV